MVLISILLLTSVIAIVTMGAIKLHNGNFYGRRQSYTAWLRTYNEWVNIPGERSERYN